MKFHTLCLFVLLVCLASCQKEDKNASLSIFKYNESSGINSLDPAFAKDQASVWAVNQLFDGLVELDSNLRIKPAIAKSWSVSSNAKRYVFNLRTDVYFHSHPAFDSKRIA